MLMGFSEQVKQVGKPGTSKARAVANPVAAGARGEITLTEPWGLELRRKNHLGGAVVLER